MGQYGKIWMREERSPDTVQRSVEALRRHNSDRWTESIGAGHNVGCWARGLFEESMQRSTNETTQ